GDIYFDQGHYPEAVIEYRSGIQLDARRGDIRMKLADAYLKEKDPSNALREYVRAADLLPSSVDAQLKAGQLLLVAHAFPEARTRAEKALALDAKNVDALVLRGNALAELKDLDGAIAEYESAIAEDPSRNQAYMSLGAIQFVQGKHAEAEEAFKNAIAADPKS